ncbi:hypothetical protein WA026_012405 [Henosepilachna vigintioctopunctata]|uniref:Helix-turn-helix domain-containing protein n=1 Tax=Henosepilachna vigintioctopunctata TaxID=420089 RepID=A0AAW1UQ23_9CUCU
MNVVEKLHEIAKKTRLQISYDKTKYMEKSNPCIHSTKMKLNIIKNLKTRILRISHNSLEVKNSQILKTLLLENGYPDTLVNKLLFNTPNAGLPECDPNDQDTGEPPRQQRIVYLTHPYVESLTHKLMNITQRSIFFKT